MFVRIQTFLGYLGDEMRKERKEKIFGSSDVEVQPPEAARLSVLDDGQEVNYDYYIICLMICTLVRKTIRYKTHELITNEILPFF